MLNSLHAGPLSEMGELREAVDDAHSVYAEGDSDLVSSDGGEQARAHAQPLPVPAPSPPLPVLGTPMLHVACLDTCLFLSILPVWLPGWLPQFLGCAARAHIRASWASQLVQTAPVLLRRAAALKRFGVSCTGQVGGGSSEEGSDDPGQEEGSVADSDAEEHEFEETAVEAHVDDRE